MNIKKIGLLGSAVLMCVALSACQDTGPESAKGKTYTVSEFLHAPDKAKETRRWCVENPAERERLPNCINASQAGLMIATGGNLSKCYKNNAVNHECIDAATER